MHLEPRLQLKQTPHLALGQRARAIRLDGKRFERDLHDDNILKQARSRFREMPGCRRFA